MVEQSDVLKRFLARTFSNQFLYLNSVSESEKTEDPKNLTFPKNGIIFNQYFVVYDLFSILSGNHHH